MFVDEKSCNELIFSVPKAVLSYFCTNLHQTLQEKSDRAQIIVLQKTDRKTAGWVLNWMMAGGVEKASVSSETSNQDRIGTLLRRIHVLRQLGIPGKFPNSLWMTLKEELLKALTISGDHIHWLYTHTSTELAPLLPKDFAKVLVNSVLDNSFSLPTICTPDQLPSFTRLRADITDALANPEVTKKIRSMQHWNPLTVAQLQFIYRFTSPESFLRKAVCRDLIDLIDKDRVQDVTIYQGYTQENPTFKDNMNAASLKKARHNEYLEREAARQKKKALAKDRQTKKVATGKKYDVTYQSVTVR